MCVCVCVINGFHTAITLGVKTEGIQQLFRIIPPLMVFGLDVQRPYKSLNFVF